MFRWLKERILSPYKNDDLSFRGKVRVYFYAHLFVIFFSILATILYYIFIPERMKYGLPIFGSGFFLSTLNLFLLANKKYNLAVNIFSYTITAVLIYMQMQKIDVSLHTAYTSYLYLLLTFMIFITFFADKLTVLILSAVIIGSNIVYFSLVFPNIKDTITMETIMSGFISTSFSFLLSGGMLYLIKSVMDSSLSEARAQSQDANAQYLHIQRIMSSSDLFDSVEKSSTALLDAGNNVRSLVSNTNEDLVGVSIQADKNLEQIHQIGRLAKRQSDDISKINQQLGRLSQHMQLATQSSQQYAESVKQTLDDAQKGSDMVSLTTQAANKVTVNTMHIAELTGNIRGIAEKVNMLSLNASIEASRAGQAGKGFSVVAEEISKLAERTSASASEISSLVKEELDSVQEVSQHINKLTESFTLISRNINQMNKFISTIFNITEDGRDISTQTERLMENISTESKQIEDSMVLQITSNEAIQKRIQSISDDMQRVSQSFLSLVELSRSLSKKSTDLKLEIIGKSF